MEKTKTKVKKTLPPKWLKKKDIEWEISNLKAEIAEFQRMLNAENKRSLLVIFQWMDASGKDSTIKNVFGEVTPMWISTKGFSAPDNSELQENYLQRVFMEVPKKWMFKIFNRSHYEDILVPSVMWILDKEKIEKRFNHINNFEEILTDEWTIILKFFLHISKKEQKKRLLERISIERKYFKYDSSDLVSRKNWDNYREVYNEIFEKTNKKNSPWFIIPSDKKWYKNYLITKKVHETLKNLDLKRPELKNKELIKIK